MLEVPVKLVRSTLAREGESGRVWIDNLPALVQHCLATWGCQVDGPIACGQVALVVPVLRSGQPAALKVSFPHPENVGEARALEVFDGRGAFRLLAADLDLFALLLERAERQTLDVVVATDQAIHIAGELARRLAVEAADDVPRLAGSASAWETQLRQQAASAGQPLATQTVDRAIATIRDLAAEPTQTMMHGDLHFGNVLRADREPWLVIDPKGWAGSAAFESFTVACERTAELRRATSMTAAVKHRIGVFADAAAVDFELSLACCQARAVSSTLYQRLHGGARAEIALLDEVAGIP